MKTSARVENSAGRLVVTLGTDDRTRDLPIAPKPEGAGSSANGGELLCLALATCYCNDLHREARKRGIDVHGVEVVVERTFESEGAAATRIAYQARVSARASRQEILDLMRHTDGVAEIQNTVRRPCEVVLAQVEVRVVV